MLSADDHVVAVVQGYSPKLDWGRSPKVPIAIRRGVLWVATNLDADACRPRAGRCRATGHWSRPCEHATGATPIATGKPDPTMHREIGRSAPAPQRPIVVGDRLDTDIEGATRSDAPACWYSAASPRRPTCSPRRRPRARLTWVTMSRRLAHALTRGGAVQRVWRARLRSMAAECDDQACTRDVRPCGRGPGLRPVDGRSGRAAALCGRAWGAGMEAAAPVTDGASDAGDEAPRRDLARLTPGRLVARAVRRSEDERSLIRSNTPGVHLDSAGGPGGGEIQVAGGELE